MIDLKNLTIQKAHHGLLKREFSAQELTENFLNFIEKTDKNIHAFLTLTSDLALKQAKRIDQKIKNGEALSLLEGVPMAVKDNILVGEVKCAAASKILENYQAVYDATIVKKLKEQGAIILGKTNMDEFAMGSSTENSAFGPTKNPHDLKKVPGGSSGGSAAAVASDQCVYALGSDTGGSIRQPASFCDVVGLKPTYGSVSRYGLIAMASSLDQIGPLAKTVEDAEIVFNAIKGKDPLDSTSVESRISKSKFQNEKFDIRNLKLGIPREYFIKGIDPEVERNVKKEIKKFEDLGAKIQEISLPHTEYALAVYYLIMPAEVSANLARYDGIRYGKTREYFGQEVRRRIMLGTYVLSAGYYDAYYLKAQKVRTLIMQDFQKAFEKVDLIITPTSPIPPFNFGDKTQDPLAMYLADIYTVPVNLAALPALSLPPNLQIIGRWFEEEFILNVAKIYERV